MENVVPLVHVNVKESDLSVYHGEKHVPPAPALFAGDTVEFNTPRGAHMRGIFKGFDRAGLAIVHVTRFMYYHVHPNRLTEVADA